MTREKGFAAYAVLGRVADDMVLDALLPEDRGVGAAPVKKKSARRLFAFLESGWGVAIICALVAVSVMGGIVWAGNQPGMSIPPAGTDDPNTETFPMEVVPPTHADGVVMVNGMGYNVLPTEFFVWSQDVTEGENGMGEAVNADGLGFWGSMMHLDAIRSLPDVTFVRNKAYASYYSVSLDRGYTLERITVYDMDMKEVLSEDVDDDWCYDQCLRALTNGRYYVSLYVTHREGATHSCGYDYAYLLTVSGDVEMTRSCTVTTDKTEYEWGNPYYVIATLTSTVEGAYLQVDDPDAWSLVNMETGEAHGVGGHDFPYESIIAPVSPTSYASSSYPLYFDWETTPPGRYRLIYTGAAPAEGERYPYCELEIYDLANEIYVQGGEHFVVPKEAMLWVEFWDEDSGTMLSGDGWGHSNLQDYASELPVLTVREGLALDVMNAEISYCVLYDQNFEILYEGKEWINTTDYVIGPFYVVFTVRTQGKYIEEVDAYEGNAYEYAFRLEVKGYAEDCPDVTVLPYDVETTPTE